MGQAVVTSASPNQPQPPEVFRNFVTASNQVFRFLVEEHGFESLGWEVNGRECTTWFRHKPNVTIMFSYEPFSAPMGNVFARFRPDQEKMIEKPMQSLARQRIPRWMHPQLVDRDTSVERLGGILKIYADLLRDNFPEILAAPDGIGERLRKGLDKK